MQVDFTANLWRWQGNGAWFFVSLPSDLADEIEDRFGKGAGFGSVKVSARIGNSLWSTSIFPSNAYETYLLPVKKQIRAAEKIDEGDSVTVHLDLHP